MNKIIIAIIIILIIGGIGVVIYFSVNTDKFPSGKNKNEDRQGENFNPKNMGKQPGNFTPGEFQINDSTKEEIVSFFNSNPSDEEIEDYCRENQMYCMYYCMEIDSEIDYCENITPPNMGDRTPPEGIGNPPQ